MVPDPATTLYVDLEVFSPVNLKSKPEPSYGTYARAGRVTHFVSAFGDEQAQVRRDPSAIEKDLQRATALVCHNMAFDFTCMRECNNVGGLPAALAKLAMPDDGPVVPLCTMAMASLLNLPRGLGALVKQLKCGEKLEYNFQDAQTKGGDLFMDGNLEEYALNDVIIMRAAFKKMLPFIKPVAEWDVMCTHERVNARGISVDRELLSQALKEQKQVAADLQDRFARKYGFKPSQTQRLLQWFQRNGHPELDSTDKRVLEKLRSTTPKDHVRAMIDLRAKTNDGDLKKLTAIERSFSGDAEGRLRNGYRYCGAHTGRFTSKGVQVHNLKRMVDDAESDAAVRARQVLVASPGTKLFISDFKQIELRVMLWLIGHADEVKQIHEGADAYLRLAQSIYGPHVTRERPNPERRLSKVASLALQYGGGVKTVSDGLGIDEKQGRFIYDGYHKKYPGLKAAVREFERAFHTVFHAGGSQTVLDGRAVLKKLGQRYISLELPCGRSIRYADVSMSSQDALFTHGLPGNTTSVWTAFTLVENYAQGYSRSFLAEAMVRFSKHPVARVVGHVHDELIAEVPESYEDLDELHQLMLPRQLPEGLYVDAESGFGTSFASK